MTTPHAEIRCLAETYWVREMANDVEGVVACYRSDALLTLPDGTEHRGAEAIRGFYERGAADYPRRVVRITDQIDGVDGRAVLLWEAELNDPEGRRFLLQGMNVVRVEGGRFAELKAAYPAPRPADALTRGKAQA